ncbi:hypothetical protein H9660_05255 [Clostridium sp. Sa3CUN1]|uniref:Uncharacterized protein n=1 Tax=Clostridium gallinarum TaxID=2762246 RepID=A0ABR8Q296_9CLOT|nr:hypothetical protein [Clostridium gallinarum]MBD7914546.1 hypothetical protein [Clostridium gallinarum]
MDKKEFKETEEKIKRYYQREKKIKSIEKTIKILDEQIDKIEKDLRNCNFNIDPEESMSSSFEERVQTSGSGISYAEREIMRVTEMKIRRVTEKKLEREKQEEILDNIERDVSEIEDIIIQLSTEHRNILEMKYKKKYNEYKIADEVHLSQSQVNKKIKQAIRIIGEWNRWNNFGIKLE